MANIKSNLEFRYVATVQLPEPATFIGDIQQTYSAEIAVYLGAIAVVSLGFLLVRSLSR